MGVNISQARAQLPTLIARVQTGEEITITRHGEPVAVLVRPDALRARRDERVVREAAELAQILADARNRPLPPAGSLTAAQAEALTADVRASRAAR